MAKTAGLDAYISIQKTEVIDTLIKLKSIL